ncbi:MAG: cytochrome c family protein, partial [Alphaproteobacteria bacterium]
PEQMGAFVFSQRCSVCHAKTAAGQTKYGPHLEGIVGRKAGATGWDGHTDALEESEIVWDEATLDKLFEDPQSAMPGVQMDVVIRFKRSREALISYLKTL